jgi:GcrA cell cycle regulator
MSKGWDSNMLKKLKALVGKGLSTAEMGKKLGMSKNAVVGKLNRLGWNAKASESADGKSDVDKKTVGGGVKKDTGKKTVVAKKVAKVVPVKQKPKKVNAVKTTNAKPDTKKSVTDKKEKNVSDKKEPISKEIKIASKKTQKDLALHELLIQHALQMANLKPNQCRWPIGDPDSDNFHFCGETVFSGKPYCYEHCRQAYQFTAPKKKQ